MLKKVLFIGAVGLLSACGGKGWEDTNDRINNKDSIAELPDESISLDGFQLMDATCFSCHSPNPVIESPIAPTLAELKIAYTDAYDTQSDFQKGMLEFLQNPSEEQVVMKNAYEKYGMMPQMSLGEEKAKVIISYIYENQVEEPGWFNKNFESEKRRIKLLAGDLSDVDRGFEFAMGTKSLLGKNLKGKLKSEGTLGALSFCNLKAYHFTDSMSQVYDAKIKRVSDKPRNPDNSASDFENEIIQRFKESLAAGDEIQPETHELETGFVNGYYPIVTNDMCMKCHGITDQMEDGVADKIATLYPNDQATGYKTNELRGIWVVKMKRRNR